jgi:hypothetical protein
MIYASLYGFFVAWANYSQYKRLSMVFPDFDAVRETQGKSLMEAKRQEWADVTRYNNMVQSMRSDMRR